MTSHTGSVGANSSAKQPAKTGVPGKPDLGDADAETGTHRRQLDEIAVGREGEAVTRPEPGNARQRREARASSRRSR